MTFASHLLASTDSVSIGTLGLILGFCATAVGAWATARKLGPERKQIGAAAELTQHEAENVEIEGLRKQFELWKQLAAEREENARIAAEQAREVMLEARAEASKAREEAARAAEKAAQAFTLQTRAEAKLAEREAEHTTERHSLRNELTTALGKNVVLEERVRLLEDRARERETVIAEMRAQLRDLEGKMQHRRSAG